MKAYKGFNKGMTCRGFQFEEGKEYHTESAKLCQSGFHACENPLDCFSYYTPGQSVYHEVELDEVSEQRGDDTKICGKTIKIGAKLDVAKICSLHFEYVKAHTTHEVKADDEKSASAGFRGSASAGESGSASAGESGSASAGIRGSASAGNYGSASAGNYGSASAGNRGSASAGESGSASAGNYGRCVSGRESSVGVSGVAVARGNNCRVKGGAGSVLVIVEQKKHNYEIAQFKTVFVDGKTIKADTWYKLENGEFVEAEA